MEARRLAAVQATAIASVDRSREMSWMATLVLSRRLLCHLGGLDSERQAARATDVEVAARCDISRRLRGLLDNLFSSLLFRRTAGATDSRNVRREPSKLLCRHLRRQGRGYFVVSLERCAGRGLGFALSHYISI